MKNLTRSLAAVLAVAITAPLFANSTKSSSGANCACCQKPAKTAAKAAPQAAALVTLSVPKMHCEGCAKGVTSALMGTPGVYSATVDVKTKRATVRYNAKKTSPAKLAEATKKIGFPASVVTGA